MTKQEREEKLIDLKARQLMKQRQLDELDPEASTEETINAIVEEIKVIQGEIEEIKNTEPAEEQPADVEEKADEEELSQEEIDEENEELKEEEERKNMNKNEVRTVKIETAEERAAMVKAVEERAKKLREGRSVTVASSNILLPNHQDSTVATVPFQQVSSFVDMVTVKSFDGGETHEVPFTKSYGTAGTTEEGAAYTNVDTVFDNALISKVKITAISEYSEEVEKLPAADYVAEIEKGVEVSLKKKISQQIVNGAGTTNTFKGITASDVEALEATDTVEVSAITTDTLDDILFQYGGDEEVLGTGVLILNKLDLKAFKKLKAEDGRAYHEVDYKNQTIDGIPYVINSNLPATATAEAGKTCMLFGAPKGYEMDVFSPVEIMKSYDEKFSEGKIRIKASVFCGGNVTAYRSFVLVKKA